MSVEAGDTAPSRSLPDQPLVSPDRPVGPDDLGRSEDAAFLAEVVLHRRLETPFGLGLFGAAGSGKTFFLNQLVAAAEGLARSAGGAGPDGPFVGESVVVRVDAARPGDPGTLLADAVLERLTESHPALAADLAHAGADPAEAARDANEALNDLRRRHQAEREALEGLGSREARLVESLLEAPGSSLDVYARGRRGAIERALRQFGFETADGIGTYKALVHEAAESPGPAARLGLAARALWSYDGQARLIILAVLLALIAWFLGALTSDGDGWVAWLRDMGEKAGPVADWAQAHVHSLGPAQAVAVVLCVLCLATVGWRAARFLRPIFKGVGLLRRDIDVRSRDLQGLLAHQTRRVDGLAAEVDAAALKAAEAERRAGKRSAAGLDRLSGVATRPAAVRPSRADALFDALAATMTAGLLHPTSGPARIVVAIDNLDARTGEGAADFVDAARQRLGPGFAWIAAADRSHLADGFGETDPARAAHRFERCIQLGYRIDADAAEGPAWSAFAARLVGARPPMKPAGLAGESDPRRSSLDRPWRPREAETVAALSVFAGQTPRAIKRYVNRYRIARADPHLRDAPAAVFTALALALALDSHGYPEDLAALVKASQGEAVGDGTVLRQALAAAREASGEPVELGQAQRGIEVAARYAARA